MEYKTPTDVWISVNDKLPTEKTLVLIYDSKAKDYGLATYLKSDSSDYEGWYYLYNDFFFERPPRVTHWMYLSEPQKEEC